MNYFLSCDWGTSMLRLRLVETDSLRVAGTSESDEGCAKLNQAFLRSGSGADKEDRERYYNRVLQAHVKELEKEAGIDLDQFPLVISGMASSSVGMKELGYKELGYKELPFRRDGSDLHVERLSVEGSLQRIYLVSGLCTGDDVMRGEETKLLGYLADPEVLEGTLILPGTHPKHVFLESGQVKGFRTYMTGEFFSLLSRESLLAGSVEANEHFDTESFRNGLMSGIEGNILHTAFTVRTKDLFGRYDKRANYHYLSGLLIGSELKDIVHDSGAVVLLGNENAGHLYKSALEILNVPLYGTLDGDQTLIKGQAVLLSNFTA